MAKKQNKQTGPLTPEQVIRIRLRRLADKEDITNFITKAVMMIAILGVMFGFVFGLARMPNKDMIPKIGSGDILLFYRLDNNYRFGDVLVFNVDGKQYVGRVIAREKDTFEISENTGIVINGSTLNEPDIYYRTSRYVSDVEYPLTMQENEYFILCDYRENAVDSRFFGCVSKKNIYGKVIAVIRRSDI